MAKNILAAEKKLRELHRRQLIENMEKEIDLSFEILDAYCLIPEDKVKDKQKSACCYAAIVLSGFVQKKMAKRVKEFLTEKGEGIHPRAHDVLSSNILRMAGF